MGCIILGVILAIFSIILIIALKTSLKSEDGDPGWIIILLIILSVVLIISGIDIVKDKNKIEEITAKDTISNIAVYEGKGFTTYYIGITYIDSQTGNIKNELIGIDEYEPSSKVDKIKIIKSAWKLKVYIPKRFITS